MIMVLRQLQEKYFMQHCFHVKFIKTEISIAQQQLFKWKQNIAQKADYWTIKKLLRTITSMEKITENYGENFQRGINRGRFTS